ncbi:MAG TPA: hypothetical protein VKP30_19020, partial [Polyangiaceae bacterium]|nr:hypothetical protein [Polyangiaceae bacterium]
ITHGTFSAASDQFSMACSLYEALSRLRAFPGDDAIHVATLITTTSASPIADRCGCNRMVDSVLQRAMHPDPNGRFPSCAEFGKELASALGANHPWMHPGALPLTSSAPTARERDVGGKTLRIVAGAGTLGALLMAAVLNLTRGCHAEDEPDPSLRSASAPVASGAKVPTRSKTPRASSSALKSPSPLPSVLDSATETARQHKAD